SITAIPSRRHGYVRDNDTDLSQAGAQAGGTGRPACQPNPRPRSPPRDNRRRLAGYPRRTRIRPLPRSLRQRQDLVAVLAYEDGVLELGGALAVLGDRGPAVRPYVVADRAQGEHGLDGERHARFHRHVVVRVVVVRHYQPGVERGADPVPGEVAHHAVTETRGVGLDARPDRVQRTAGGDGADAAHHRLACPLHQQPRFLVHVSGEERRVRVPVHPADECRYVDIHDVAVVDDGV